VNTRIAAYSTEHRYYVAAAAGIIAVVLAGFSVDAPLLSDMSHVSVLVRLHGGVMLAWVALFFTQTVLVAKHRVDLHRRFGIFGAGLAILVVVVDVATLVVACRLGADHMPPGMPAPLFLALGISNLAVFAILVGSAIALRRRSDWHKRLMLLAALILLDAALARFISHYTSWTLDASTLRNLLMCACIAVDTFRHRRLHRAFIAGGLLLIANDHLANWLAGTTVWMQFADWVILGSA